MIQANSVYGHISRIIYHLYMAMTGVEILDIVLNEANNHTSLIMIVFCGDTLEKCVF